MKLSFNNITVAFLIVVLLAYSFKTVTVIADFALHQDQIAKTLCEQKDVIEQTCNGKCQLVIALKSDLDLEQNQTPLEQTEKRFVSFNYLQPVNKTNLANTHQLVSKPNFHINTNPVISMNYAIIIPPPKHV